MNEPMISIICPVYNVEKYLVRCISSLICQTYANIEIILVDDGSTDNSGKICDDYAGKDNRISVIHKENGGLSSARNTGIDVASGDYILFVDSDDSISPRIIEDFYARIIDTESDMVIGGIKRVDEQGKYLDSLDWGEDAVVSKHEYWVRFFEQKNGLGVVVNGKLYKKRIFDDLRFDEGKIFEDELIIHKIIDLCDRICIINDEYYFYTKRNDGIMGKTKGVVNGYDKVEAYIKRAEYLYNTNELSFSLQCLEDAINRYFMVVSNPNNSDIKRKLEIKKMLSDVLRKVEGNSKRYLLKKSLFLYAYKAMEITWIIRERIRRLKH
nr:glycosyltransferase [uncultured Butyrivibrio sp.]